MKLELYHAKRFFHRCLAYGADLLVVYVAAVLTLAASVLVFGFFRYESDPKMIRALLASPETQLFARAAHALLYFAYFTLFHWYGGRTPGKWLLGLEVTHEGSSDLSFSRSLGRSFAYVLSGQLTLGLGFLVALFRKDGRCLHDILCHTDVRPKAKEETASAASSLQDAA